MKELGINAKKAAHSAHMLSTEDKNKVLKDLKTNLLNGKYEIFDANEQDIMNAEIMGLSEAMIDRLRVDEDYLNTIVMGLDDVIKLDDPIGEILEERTLDNGLELTQVSVPLGVVGIIYESRPNVTVDAFALNFKVSNACILRGGKEAINTNIVFEAIIHDTLRENNIDENMVQLIKDITRESTQKLMKMNEYVDVLIPRGSQGLIDAVLKNSTIPVIETGAGNCHIYVDESADLDKAVNIIENAKLQRPGVCNAVESLVVHKNIADKLIIALTKKLDNVAIYGDAVSQGISPEILKAGSDDYYTEYLDLKMSLKVVGDIHEAIDHVNTHHTHHSDAIIT
ncbi:MAG TPA: glutamate-5-semialdehyde dehydrogenase, partial [Erysipelothrix sp.]|nr:glutamate-5-semialdehyde dehydrogenase [Erysipelothrix sp.]